MDIYIIIWPGWKINWLLFFCLLPVQFNSFNGNSTVLGITVDAFHAIVTDFFRIKIAAVAFAAADAFPVI